MKKYVIAIDAGGTFFKSAVISSEAEVLEGSVETVPANSDGTPDDVREGYFNTLALQLDHAHAQQPRHQHMPRLVQQYAYREHGRLAPAAQPAGDQQHGQRQRIEPHRHTADDAQLHAFKRLVGSMGR